LEVREVLYTF